MAHPSPQAVLVDAEVDLLADLVDGARVLGEGIRDGQLATEEDARSAQRAVLAVIATVSIRLRVLARCLRRTLDPQHLLGPHNSVPVSAARVLDRVVLLPVRQVAPVKVRTNRERK